jgi:very-short-patch-repair endonuclease
MKKCKFCNLEFDHGRKLGGHQIWCKKNPERKSLIEKSGSGNRGRKLSDEQKKKISESRKKYLQENPEMVPYKLNHSSKISYPERYFLRVLRGFIFQYKVPGTLYEIDFANQERKIAIEIDGEQHYEDRKMVDHDLKRDKILKDLGWKTIRIRWSQFQSLDKDQRKKVIDKIMTFTIDPEKDIIFFYEFKKSQERSEKNKKYEEKKKIINERINKILESNINFGKIGWVSLVSELLGIKKNGGGKWIRKNMPDFYLKECFKRSKKVEKRIKKENQNGENNHAYGKIWVFNEADKINKLIVPAESNFYLENNWKLGMKKFKMHS